MQGTRISVLVSQTRQKQDMMPGARSANLSAPCCAACPQYAFKPTSSRYNDTNQNNTHGLKHAGCESSGHDTH